MSKTYQDDFNNIVVPVEQVDLVIHKAVSKGQKHLKVKRRMTMGASVLLLCACVFGSGFVAPSMAKVLANIPFVGSVFEMEKFATSGLGNLADEDVAKFDDLQITDQGITVAIREAYYDQTGFAVGYVVSGANLSDEKNFHAYFYYNGRAISGGGGGWHDKIDTMYIGLEQFQPGAGLTLPDSFELEVVITDDLEEVKRSPYRFKIPVSRIGVDEKTKEALVMKAIDTSEGTLLVKKVLFTPAATEVEYEFIQPGSDGKRYRGYSVGNCTLKLIDSSGVALEPGASLQEGRPEGEKWVDTCRVDFPSMKEPAGNMAFELISQEGRKIRVDFAVK